MNRTPYEDSFDPRRDDAETPPARRHGLNPAAPLGYHELTLRFLYLSLPEPPVSTAAPLSGASGGGGGGVDRIGMLPDDLLFRIISRLPSRDRARTTAFSKRWRGLWRSEPLVLVDTHLLPGGDAAEGRRPPRDSSVLGAVTSAVSAAFEAHLGPFSFVSLTCSFMDGAHRGVLDRWVHLLATKLGKFAFLMFVAENARVLETMVILIKDELREELTDKTTALCSARWASGESKARFVTGRLAGDSIA